MINLEELEKVVTSGKVVTLVIMVDSKELAALSFTLDTVAFKEILETVTKEPVVIAEKAKDDKMSSNKEYVSQKKAESKAKTTDKPVEPKPAPAPVAAAQISDDDDNDDDISVDEATGEIIEDITPDDINNGKATVSGTINQLVSDVEQKAAIDDADVFSEEKW